MCLTLEQAISRTNNKPHKSIRPVYDGELIFYSFTVVDGIVYDAKNRRENTDRWVWREFVIEDDILAEIKDEQLL